VKQRSELVGGREPPKSTTPSSGKRTPQDLPREIQQQLAMLSKQVPHPGDHIDDNSNTQFAILALWVGRRHGMPVDQALARVDMRFRTSQNADGGWGYRYTAHTGRPGKGNSTPTMTCAGLLGLAVSHGILQEA